MAMNGARLTRLPGCNLFDSAGRNWHHPASCWARPMRPQSPAEEHAMRTSQDLPACPVAVTVHLIGSKWKLLILQQLSSGAMRFNELQNALAGISNKVLSTTLRSLDEDGIIIRDVHPASPISVRIQIEQDRPLSAPRAGRHGRLGRRIPQMARRHPPGYGRRRVKPEAAGRPQPPAAPHHPQTQKAPGAPGGFCFS